MTQPTFKYNREKSCLEEQPRMKRPHIRPGGNPTYEIVLLREYERHIASLRSIPTTHTDWPTGDLIEGKHFIEQYYVNKNGKWINTDVVTYSHSFGVHGQENELDCRKILAVPIPPTQPKEENEEEQWKQVIEIIRSGIIPCSEILNHLQLKYKLSELHRG